MVVAVGDKLGVLGVVGLVVPRGVGLVEVLEDGRGGTLSLVPKDG
jgi:hypothetical protein